MAHLVFAFHKSNRDEVILNAQLAEHENDSLRASRGDSTVKFECHYCTVCGVIGLEAGSELTGEDVLGRQLHTGDMVIYLYEIFTGGSLQDQHCITIVMTSTSI